MRFDYVEGAHGPPVAYIEGLFVKDNWRHMGIGKKLIDLGTEWGGKRIVSKWLLTQNLIMLQALPFTSKWDFWKQTGSYVSLGTYNTLNPLNDETYTGKSDYFEYLIYNRIYFRPKFIVEPGNGEVGIVWIGCISHSYDHHLFTRDYIDPLIGGAHGCIHVRWRVGN